MLVENTGGGGSCSSSGSSNSGVGGSGESKTSSNSNNSSKPGLNGSKIGTGGGGGGGGASATGGGGNRPMSSSSSRNSSNVTVNGSYTSSRNTVNGTTSHHRTTSNGNITPARTTSNGIGTPNRTSNGPVTPTRTSNVVSTSTRSTTNGIVTPSRNTSNTTCGPSNNRNSHMYTPSRIVNGSAASPYSTNGTASRVPLAPNRTTSTMSSNRSTTSSSTSSGGGSKNATPTKSISGDLDSQLSYTPPHVLIRSISSLSQHSIRPSTPELDQEDGVVSVPALRKGVLLQARDRLFSRWKERYFVLTRDYLACFRRGSTKYSEMGSFIFKVNLASVEAVEWQDRRGGPALALSLPREGRVLLRAKSGLDQWYRLLLEATNSSRLRRNALRRGTSTTQLNHSTNNNLDTTPPTKSGLPFSLSGSTPEITRLCESVCDDSPGGSSGVVTRHHRFSLLSDVDLESCDTDVATPPSSVTSSNKFSTSTSASNTSGSGGSSSLASSPSLRGSCAWPRPSSPLRPVVGDSPRSRLSLYEGTREMPTSAKMRHSVCLEPRDQGHDMAARKQKNRHSICVEPRDLARTRASLCLEPRNPLLDLMESVEAIPSLLSQEDNRSMVSTRASPSKSEGDRRSNNDVPLMMTEVNTSPCPEENLSRPRAHSTSLTPERSLGPRSRSNLGFFRHSGLYNH